MIEEAFGNSKGFPVFWKGERMRGFIYLIVILNAIIGFILIYRRPRPFKGKTYKDYEEK